MNERLKELILKAGWTNAYTDPKYGFEPVFEGEDHNLACIEKFTELIVRECADVAVKFHLAHPYSVEYQVKKHFGVE
jgi:hypothetical protein